MSVHHYRKDELLPIDSHVACESCHESSSCLSHRNADGLIRASFDIASYTDPDTGNTTWWHEIHLPKLIAALEVA